MLHDALSRRAALARIAGASVLAVAARPARALGASPPGAFVPATDPRLTVEGRTASGPNGTLRVGYPGVAFRFAADAPRVTMQVAASSADSYLDVAVDGAPPRRVRLTRRGRRSWCCMTGPRGATRSTCSSAPRAWR